MYTTDPYVGSPRGRQQTHARVLPMESQRYHPYHYQRIHRSSDGMYFNDGSSLPPPTPSMNHTHVSLKMPIQSSNTHDLGPAEPPNGQQIGKSSSYASSTNVANSQQHHHQIPMMIVENHVVNYIRRGETHYIIDKHEYHYYVYFLLYSYVIVVVVINKNFHSINEEISNLSNKHNEYYYKTQTINFYSSNSILESFSQSTIE
jgi:hypothetical protein